MSKPTKKTAAPEKEPLEKEPKVTDDSELDTSDEDIARILEGSDDDPEVDDSFLDDDDSFLNQLDDSGLIGNGSLDGDDDTDMDDTAPEAEEESADVAALKAEIEKLQEKLARSDKKNETLALQLHDANTAQERLKEQFTKNAKRPLENAVKKLLDPIDNLERAYEAIPDAECENNTFLKNTKEGLRMTIEQISQTLASVGITKVDGAGANFDPNYHEAVSAGQDQGKDDNTVLHVVQNGYKSEERLLRPAKVIVNKLS
ncbi:MAG: nucleotide exchange factor GrpE [Alphaproteobacteria bacterium]|nr:MAG: nucleotide exchange factor GrpE [Alphaproteobacteria bacterium]